MASGYPGSLDNFATNKADATTSATDHKDHHNDLADAVNKVEAELGTNPSAAHSTVAVATAALMGRWVPIFDAHVNLSAAAAAVYPAHRTVTEDQAIGAASPAGYNVAFMFLDPADYAITGYTLKYRVVASFSQNAVNNAATSVATAGLYPYVGAGATTTWLATLGTVIAGSTAARTAGNASTEARVISTTFTAPAADTYALAVAITTATTAGSTRINVRLEYSYA
jgi:hypothetical protein